MFNKRYVIINSDEKFTALASSVIELSGKFNFVNAYTSCEDAIRRLHKDLPDIIIMDLDFVQMKGPEAIEAIKRLYSKIEILVVSDYDDDAIIIEVISCGATGYLRKNSCIPNLVESMTCIVNGGAPIHSTIARKLLNNLRVNLNSPLTSRENEILKLITQGKTYSIIADELKISTETSKTHIKNIYRKLNVTTKSEVIKKAISEKLVSANL